MKTLYVGCDVSKKSFETTLCTKRIQERVGELKNTPHGYKKLAKLASGYIQKGYQIQLIVEPTGTYHLGLVGFAHEQGWAVSLPNPVLVRQWAKGQGYRVKTDHIDALTLGTYGYKERPSGVQPLPEQVESLDIMLRRQEDIEKSIRQERNRLESFEQRPTSCEPVQASLLSAIAFFEAELFQLRLAIKAHLQQYPDLARQRTLLLSVPGIGEKGVLKVLVFLYRWDARTSSQGNARGLVAFAGLDPLEYSSGSSIHRHPPISKMGDAQIRRTLFMSALGGVKAKDSPLVHFYNRLVARGKAKKIALVAGARKILTWAFGVFRSGLLFDPAKALPKSL